MAKRTPSTARQRPGARAGRARRRRGAGSTRHPQDDVRHLATRELLRRAALATPLLGGLVVLALLAFSIGGDGDDPGTTEGALSSTTVAVPPDAAAEGPGGGDDDANAEAGSVTAAGGDDQSTGGSRGDDGARRPGAGADSRSGADGREDGEGDRRSGADAGGEGEPPITDCEAYPPRITVHLPWCSDQPHRGAGRRGGRSPGSAPDGDAADLDARAAVVSAGEGDVTGAGERGSGHVARTRRGGHDRATDGHRSGRHGSPGGSPTIVVTPLAVVAPTIISVGPPPRRPHATSAAHSSGSGHGRAHHRPTRDPHPGERPNARDTSGSNTGSSSSGPRLTRSPQFDTPHRNVDATDSATADSNEATSNDAPSSNAESGSPGGRLTTSTRPYTLDRNAGTGPADTPDVADSSGLTRADDQAAADVRPAPSPPDADRAALPPAPEQEQDPLCPVAGGWCGSEAKAPAAAELRSIGDEGAAAEATADTPPASEAVQPGPAEGAEIRAFRPGSSDGEAMPVAATAPSTEPATPPAPPEDSAAGADGAPVAAGAVVAETVPVDTATPTGTFMEATG